MSIIGSEEMTEQNGKKREEEAIIQRAKELREIRQKAMINLFTNGAKLSKSEESLLKGLEIGKRKAIVTVGHYRVRKPFFINPFRNPLDVTDDYETFPFAYVHKAGENFIFGAEWDDEKPVEGTGTQLKAGNIVALYDWKTNTCFNPMFKAYMVNELSNSNGERSDAPPYATLNNCQEYYKDQVFLIDPTKTLWDVRDHFTFLIDIMEVRNLFQKAVVIKAAKSKVK